MFSELSLIAAEAGLSYSDGDNALCGKKRGFGVTVSDRDGRYIVDIFCEEPGARKVDIVSLINSLGEGLPKNTLLSQSLGHETVTVVLGGYSLLQENAVYLIEFLDKLTDGLSALGIAGKPYRFFAEDTPPEAKPAADVKRVKLGFDLRSVLGIAGAVVGAAAMVVIAVLLVNVKAETDAFGLSTEISAYILSGLTAAVVFADYRFLARKLDACGVMICPVLTLAAVILSGLGAGVKALAQLSGAGFMTALREYPAYLASAPEIDGFVMGYITRGTVLAAVACVALCVLYFSRHPDETVLSEKVIADSSGAPEKR
ncbi:MAG: hypothetical protein K5876_07630 [Ruminiclostridium sp.]|nr:hypothetical protein [Ruminiclostridium sp.]